MTTIDRAKMLSRLLPARGRLFVISGPSGVGKGTVIRSMLGSPAAPPRLTRCITATTREPREHEVEGVHYHFLSKSEFECRARKDYFLEYAPYNNQLYGTPRLSVEQEQTAGNDVLLEIEVQGGLSIRKMDPEAVLVFLAPPSWSELERRLLDRATDNQTSIAQRLERAAHELDAAPQYDYLVVNDNLDCAVDTLRAIILAERQRI